MRSAAAVLSSLLLAALPASAQTEVRIGTASPLLNTMASVR